MPSPNADNETLKLELAWRIVVNHWIGTASDLYSANRTGLPIGFGVGFEARLARLHSRTLSSADVAFNLDLPVLDGLPLRELLALRRSEQDAFDSFQDSLATAIRTGIKGAGPADDASDVARAIQDDVIEPALHRIRQQLRSAESVLVKAHHVNIGLAGLATACGAFGIRDAAVGLVIAAAAAVANAEAVFASQRRDIEGEGMYFLWRAKEYETKSKRTKRI